MVRILTICSVLLLSGCISTPKPIIQTKIVEVYVPVPAPAPRELVNLDAPLKPLFPINSDSFLDGNNYWSTARNVSITFNMMKQYILTLEAQNQLYRDYIQSLPTPDDYKK